MSLGIVILGAGQGTRMRSRLPKVLHRLAGRPLLGHVLDTALALNPDQVAIVYGHGGEQVPETMAERPVRWVEQARQLGTGHAVVQALPAVADCDQVLVLYGDVPLIELATLRELVAAARDTALAILTAILDDPGGYGRIVRDADGRVLRIVEQKDASEAELEIDETNTGIMIADRERLQRWLERVDNRNVQGEYYLTDVIGLAAAEGVSVLAVQPSAPEEVMGVNDLQQLSVLERYHQQRQAEALMRAGVTLADPARFDLRGRLHVGRDLFLDVNLVVEGEVTLGDGVRVGPNVLLHNCRIGADTEILANTVIEDAEIGAGSRIGPFARIRPDTQLAESVHVGNFVEIKKSSVASGSKINHLSYIGDTTVGSRVNIGAGTITCNYDGANKHRTLIGDDAFIGSDTQLVAPVEVGPGATIGAGSTITQDTPAEKLTLSRARQVVVEGWERPRKPPKP